MTTVPTPPDAAFIAPGEPARTAPRLVWLAGFGAAAIAVVLVGAMLLGNPPFAWDRALLLALRVPGDPAQPIGPAWLREALIDITALGGVTILTLTVAVVAGLLMVERLWLSAAMVVAATLSGSILSTQAKFWVGRPRPALADHLVQVSGLSFPSGHATNSAIVYLTLASLVAQVVHGRRIRSYTFGAAILLVGAIGTSRVYLGVHWPSDVLAGWSAGTAWALLWWWLGARLRTSFSG